MVGTLRVASDITILPLQIQLYHHCSKETDAAESLEFLCAVCEDQCDEIAGSGSAGKGVSNSFISWALFLLLNEYDFDFIGVYLSIGFAHSVIYWFECWPCKVKSA